MDPLERAQARARAARLAAPRRGARPPVVVPRRVVPIDPRRPNAAARRPRMLTAKAAALPPDGQPEIGPSETKSDRDFERRVPRECPVARDCEPAPKATKNRPRDSLQRRTIVWLSVRPNYKLVRITSTIYLQDIYMHFLVLMYVHMTRGRGAARVFNKGGSFQ